MRTLPIHQPKDLASVLPDADPLGMYIYSARWIPTDKLALDLIRQLLSFSPDSRIDVVQALSHPYVAFHHDEAVEPSCPKVFDKWEQVEGLETIEELREAISREIEEFRAEVRNVDIWSSSDEEEEVDEEQEVLEGDEEEEADVTVTSIPVTDYFPTIPVPSASALSSTSTSPIIQQRELGLGTSPKTTTSAHMMPAMSRTKSRGRGNTPQSPAMDEPTYSNGTTISRRTSAHSASGRRPASFLFSPFGNGMTPLPSMISSQSQGGSVPSGLSANGTNNNGATASNAPGHGHSASVDFYNGRRSRATSTTGDYSLRPLIRQLSTVGMGVGGDDGVPVAGAESSKAGLGLEGMPIPTRQVAAGGGGDDGLPPMGVSPSDAPPSTVCRV
jgi:serine/threonine protein kinase